MNVPYNKPNTQSHVLEAFFNRLFAAEPEDCENTGIDQHAPIGSIDIYITTFGNDWFIDYQIKTLRRFMTPPYNIIVVDTNQNLNPEISAKVKETCIREGAIYLKAPDNHYQEPFFFDSTMKLGTTLSWLFHKVVKKRRPTYFGFLDHDCFLFRHFDPCPYLDEKGMYGTVSRNLPKWNLHVIANFFKLDAVSHLPLDFRASYAHQLDTGGANFNVIYQHKKMEDYMLPHFGVRYTPEDICRKDAVQHYEIIDNKWFHVAATSHDQLVGDGEKKLLYARGFIEGALRAFGHDERPLGA